MTVTPSNSSTSANSAVIAASMSGDRMPSADWKTIEPPNPLLAPGKYCCKVSKPAVLSEAGDSNSPSLAAPIATPAMLIPISANIQTAITVQCRR